MPELFLSTLEKENFAKWHMEKKDRSISTRLFTPFWKFVASYIPDTVAPNLLSLAALICLLHAYYVCFMYMPYQPRSVVVAALGLVFIYQTLEAIDGLHAHNTKNDSPLGELFAHACATIGCVFLMLTLCSVLGITNSHTSWYIVQTAQLVFLVVHLRAFKAGAMRNPLFTGPGEALMFFMILMGIRATIGFGFLSPVLSVLRFIFTVTGLDKLDPTIRKLVALNQTDDWIYYGAQGAYHLIYFYTLYEVFTLKKKNYGTRNALFFCLIYRVVPAILIYVNWVKASSAPLDVICDGLFLSILTNDMMLAKMAQRDLHPWVALFAMLSVFDNFVILLLCFVYHIAVFADLSIFMNLNLFSINKNVYVDGVYDMCHIGHTNSFKNALAFGNRLFVGVLSDQDVMSYKRAPIMTMEERVAVVSTQKYVYKVIPSAPFPGIPAEFIRKWNIHVVCHSGEYEKSDDIYYAIPRAMGITKILPRTDGMSTSELIGRMKRHHEREEEKEKRSPTPGSPSGSTSPTPSSSSSSTSNGNGSTAKTDETQKEK